MNCAEQDLLLYAVTDRHWLHGRTLHEVVKESLDGGVTFLQLREKDLDEAHFLDEARADYLGVGAVFPTGSKADAKEVEWDVLREICQAVSIPVVAIGGITQENVTELAGTGICGVAVISAIYAQEDIPAAAKNLKNTVKEMIAPQ